jgi:hypothetical protein
MSSIDRSVGSEEGRERESRKINAKKKAKKKNLPHSLEKECIKIERVLIIYVYG